MKLRSKKFAAICCATVLTVACAVPAFADSGNFLFNMEWGQGSNLNSYGFVKKYTDHDPYFYVTPSSSGWNPNYDEPHVYAINTRKQECNRDNHANRLMGNYRHKIAYYSASVPAPRQEMNIELKEFSSGLHKYTLGGIWTP